MKKLRLIVIFCLVSISSMAGPFDEEPMVRVRYGNINTNLESVKEASQRRFGDHISLGEMKRQSRITKTQEADELVSWGGEKVFTGMHSIDLVKKGIVQLENPIVYNFLNALKKSAYEEQKNLLIRIMSGEFYNLSIGDLNIIMDQSSFDETLRYGVPGLQLGKLDIVLSLDFTLALKNKNYKETKDSKTKFLELVNRPEEAKPYLNQRGWAGVYEGSNFFEYFVEFQSSHGLLGYFNLSLVKGNRSNLIDSLLPEETNAENTRRILDFYLEKQLLSERAISEISERFSNFSEITDIESIITQEQLEEGDLQDPSQFLREEML